MALNLLDSFGAKGVSYGLYTAHADVIDTEYLSRYFVVSEFNPTFAAGKNSFAANGSSFLVNGGEILIECLDSTGKNLFIEMATYSDVTNAAAYKEATSHVFSIHVYNDTADGVGKVILYGTLVDGRSVKWIQNITINKALKNHSRARFYQSPIIEVDSAEIPILSSVVSSGLVSNENFTGTINGLAINPTSNVNFTNVNKATTDVDYRLTLITPIVTNGTPDYNAFNSQMVGATVHLNINTIKSPISHADIAVSQTASYVIKNVISNNTIQIDMPYYYTDSFGNNSVTNITNANFSIQYPFINYNNATSSYQTTTIGGVTYIVKQSYADITYRNIRTFSGYVARHKIYRRSLLSGADFTVISDEPISTNQILLDALSQNKFYEILGKFYNSQHIARYWFTSSNNLSLVHSPSYAVDSMYMSASIPPTGKDYFMVKNDSVATNRDANYVPFDVNQFLSESGSAYDSNFMFMKANVQYAIDISAVINKNPAETNANLTFYFTSSVPAASKDPAYTTQYGIKIAELQANQSSSIVDFTDVYTFYTPKSDLYGTLVVVPTLCNAYIKNISFSVFGDDGFSPDVYTTRIPWPVSVANECFQIRAELFDVNNNLIYSDLNALQNFDPSGSTLIPYIPGGGSYQDLHVSGSLYVSQSAIIQFGDLYIPNIIARPGIPDISQSRMLSIRADGAIVFDPIVDITSDSSYLYLSLGDGTDRLSTTVTTKKSLASEYDSLAGRKIYWVAGVKQIETSP